MRKLRAASSGHRKAPIVPLQFAHFWARPWFMNVMTQRIFTCSSGKLSGQRRKYAWHAFMNPLPFCRSPSKLGGGEGFKSFLVLVAEATGCGAGAAVAGEFCGCIPASIRSVLFNASSIWVFWVFWACWLANLSSISASRVLVSSETKSIFSEAGEGNSGGVTTCSLDDEPEKARRQKREILAVGQREFRCWCVYLVLM